MNLSFTIVCVSDFNYYFPKTFTLNTNRGSIVYTIEKQPLISPDGAICVFRDYKNIPKLMKEIRDIKPNLLCILATNKKDQLYHLSIKNTMYMDKIIVRDMLLELTKAITFDYDLQFTITPFNATTNTITPFDARTNITSFDAQPNPITPFNAKNNITPFNARNNKMLLAA